MSTTLRSTCPAPRPGIDLGMLANDLAEVLSSGHQIDVDATDVRACLDTFLADLEGHAHDRQATSA